MMKTVGDGDGDSGSRSPSAERAQTVGSAGRSEGPLSRALADASSLATQGQLTESRLRAIADHHALPARLFRLFLARVEEMDLSIIDDPVEEGLDGDDDDLAGWDGDGFGEFLARTRHRVLTATEERALAQEIDAGQLARQALANHPDMPLAVQRDLGRRVRLGDRAFESFVLSNIRLVVSIAARHQQRGLELEDLVQEGLLGLRHAVEKFDYRRGLKFSTYATWWIRQSIGRAIDDQCSTVRIPVHTRESIRQVQRSERRLTAAHGRVATVAEVAESVHLPAARVRQLLALARPVVSLDAPVMGGDTSLSDRLGGDDPVPDKVNRTMLRRDLMALLDHLDERQRHLMGLRFGLEDGEVWTLDSIGTELGLTRERVRQLEATSLAALRPVAAHRQLNEYLGH